MPKPKTDPVEPSNVWTCSCAPEQAMSASEFRQHLWEVHGIPPADHRGTRQMRMHMDMADSYTSVYDWTIGGVHATQCTTMPRRGGWHL